MWNLWELKRWHSQRSGSTKNEPGQFSSGSSHRNVSASDPNREPASFDADGEAVRTHCGEYVPSRRDIQRECAKIQAEWSEAERVRRAGGRSRAAARWQVPVVHASVQG